MKTEYFNFKMAGFNSEKMTYNDNHVIYMFKGQKENGNRVVAYISVGRNWTNQYWLVSAGARIENEITGTSGTTYLPCANDDSEFIDSIINIKKEYEKLLKENKVNFTGWEDIWKNYNWYIRTGFIGYNEQYLEKYSI